MNAIQTTSKRNEVGFADKPALGALRTIFPILSDAAPWLATNISLRIFLTPQRHKTPKWEMEYQQSAARGIVEIEGQRVTTYTWGTGKKVVLLCHSWGGRGTQLATFVKPLLERGCSVVAFDAPAHGRSTGKRTDMMEYSSAINGVINACGDVHAIIGHSFGAGNTMFSKQLYGFKVNKIVLVGCFAHGAWVTEKFGEVLNIPSKIIQRMRERLENKYDRRLKWNELDIVDMVSSDSSDVMLVHDRDDREIPYFNAVKFLESCKDKITFIGTQGLGHRRVLRDPEVVKQVCDFASKK